MTGVLISGQFEISGTCFTLAWLSWFGAGGLGGRPLLMLTTCPGGRAPGGSIGGHFEISGFLKTRPSATGW